MNLIERCKIYQAIEDYRKRPLIVYTTSTREGIHARMGSDAVREFIDQIDSISDSNEVDILVHSTGGDGLTAWKLMSILRERFDKVYVLVPYVAFSAATLFALGANEIVMHPHSSLGPIDPQLTVFQPDTGFRHFAYEDVGAFLRFLSDDVNISEQIHTSKIIDRLFSAVDPVNIGAAKRASELSSSVGERLLRLHMTDPDDRSKAKEIAENLNKSFSDHSDVVSRSRAIELGLRISPADKHLENLIWNAYLGLEEYMKFRHPFDLKQHYLQNHNDAQNLHPLAPLRLPENAPQDIIKLTWQTIIDQAIHNCLTLESTKIDFSLVYSVVESVRFASEFVRTGYLTSNIDQFGERNISITDIESKWYHKDSDLA